MRWPWSTAPACSGSTAASATPRAWRSRRSCWRRWTVPSRRRRRRDRRAPSSHHRVRQRPGGERRLWTATRRGLHAAGRQRAARPVPRDARPRHARGAGPDALAPRQLPERGSSGGGGALLPAPAPGAAAGIEAATRSAAARSCCWRVPRDHVELGSALRSAAALGWSAILRRGPPPGLVRRRPCDPRGGPWCCAPGPQRHPRGAGHGRDRRLRSTRSWWSPPGHGASRSPSSTSPAARAR